MILRFSVHFSSLSAEKCTESYSSGMASRRKRRKKNAEPVDPLGGFSMDQLLGLDPVLVVERKPSLIGRLVKAPFKLAGSITMLPFRILKAVLPPYGKKSD